MSFQANTRPPLTPPTRRGILKAPLLDKEGLGVVENNTGSIKAALIGRLSL
jgi:hypothetical protein